MSLVFFHYLFIFRLLGFCFKKIPIGVAVVAQWKWIWLVSTRVWIWSLAFLSGLGIRCYRELWCRLQTAWIPCYCCCGFDFTPSLRSSICCGCSPKKQIHTYIHKLLPILASLYLLRAIPFSDLRGCLLGLKSSENPPNKPNCELLGCVLVSFSWQCYL